MNGLKKLFSQFCKFPSDIGENGIVSINGEGWYESMNHHALSSGPLEFPMMGWPYYVRNSTKDIAFNDLYTL
jgi:hypothetical protein